MTLLDSGDLAEIRNALLARCAELHDRVGTIDTELHVPLDADWEEAAVQAGGTATLDRQEQLLAREWAEVKAAIARIDTGSYGLCAQCGEPIAPSRLKARPESTLCIVCANAGAKARGANHGG